MDIATSPFLDIERFSLDTEVEVPLKEKEQSPKTPILSEFRDIPSIQKTLDAKMKRIQEASDPDSPIAKTCKRFIKKLFRDIGVKGEFVNLVPGPPLGDNVHFFTFTGDVKITDADGFSFLIPAHASMQDTIRDSIYFTLSYTQTPPDLSRKFEFDISIAYKRTLRGSKRKLGCVWDEEKWLIEALRVIACEEAFARASVKP